MYQTCHHINAFVDCVRKTLIDIGMPYLWMYHNVVNVQFIWFKENVTKCLKNLYIQEWFSYIDNSSIYSNYRMFKESFGQDPYFTLLPQDCVLTLLKFRTTNNQLPVNVLRYQDVTRNERICQKCDLGDVADEFHILFTCTFFKRKREELIPTFYRNRPNSIKYKALMQCVEKKVLLKLKRFITIVNRELSLVE